MIMGGWFVVIRGGFAVRMRGRFVVGGLSSGRVVMRVVMFRDVCMGFGGWDGEDMDADGVGYWDGIRT